MGCMPSSKIWDKIAPNAKSEASVSRTICSDLSKWRRIGADVNKLLSFEKEAITDVLTSKGTFFRKRFVRGWAILA